MRSYPKKNLNKFILNIKAVVTILHLALLPENVKGPKGEFWADMKNFDWKKASYSFR